MTEIKQPNRKRLLHAGSNNYSAIGLSLVDLNSRVDRLVIQLEKMGIPDLVCTGTSGLSMGMALFMRGYRSNILYVRKIDDINSHGRPFELIGGRDKRVALSKLVFIDDLSCTGCTYRNVKSQVETEFTAEVVASVYYNDL